MNLRLAEIGIPTAGNITITFPEVPTGRVWTGTLSIPKSPSNANWTVSFAGFSFTFTGVGPFGAIQVWEGEQIVITGTGVGLAALTANLFGANDDRAHAPAYYGPLALSGSSNASTGSQTFNFTGSVQSFTVPTGVTQITVDAAGGQGGPGALGQSTGGLGGRAQGVVTVAPGDTLLIYAAGAGGLGSAAAGGFGHGTGGASGTAPAASNYAGSGGGSSAVVDNNTSTLLIEAAGGGGGVAHNFGNGGDGGGTTGVSGNGIGGGTPPTGGTQVAAGNGGTGGTHSGANGSGANGGAGGNSDGNVPGGGGGAGFFGGGGGGGDNAGSIMESSGAGGSSKIPAGGTTTSAFQTGNGYVTLSW